jgi:hypothetical protein
VRRNVHRLSLTDCEWPEAVEEAPWTDEAPVSDRKDARDHQRTQVHFSIRRHERIESEGERPTRSFDPPSI